MAEELYLMTEEPPSDGGGDLSDRGGDPSDGRGNPPKETSPILLGDEKGTVHSEVGETQAVRLHLFLPPSTLGSLFMPYRSLKLHYVPVPVPALLMYIFQ